VGDIIYTCSRAGQTSAGKDADGIHIWSLWR